MIKENPKVDTYLAIGCGRCPLGNTPECKVNNWREELIYLRQIVLDCGLTEELKWGVPVYTLGKSNILIVSAFKEYASISFFKGALLKDSNEILIQQTENVQSGRIIRFTSVDEIIKLESVLKSYIYEAIEVEKSGLKITYKTTAEFDMPKELQTKLDEDPVFRNAFEALTPGRQRGYILHFSQPKQAKTRTERIEKLTPQILNGKGLHDDYHSMRKK